MSLPRSVAEVLKQHVTLEVEGIDRMYLNVYQPRLQTDRASLLSSAFTAEHLRLFGAHGPHEQVVRRCGRSLRQAGTDPPDHLHQGARKDDIARNTGRASTDRGDRFRGQGAGEDTVFRTEKRRNPQTGQTYPWIVRTTAMVNHYYFYCMDGDFGPFFLKFCTYFPYNAKLCINGHEYVKRQLAKEGIAFEALDNGILSCADPKRLQPLCDGLSAAQDRRPAAEVAGALAPPLHARGSHRPAIATTCRSSRPSSP